MQRPIGLDLRPSARTGLGTPGMGGTLLAGAGAAAIVSGVARRSVPGAALALVGVGLAYRGLTGMGMTERLFDPTSAARPRFRLSMASRPDDAALFWSNLTINREREPVFLFWRDSRNLLRLDSFVTDVTEEADTERWRTRLPMGTTAEIELTREEMPLERIAWQAADTSRFRFCVDLRDGPTLRGTEVVLTASLPADGPLGPARRMLAPLRQAQLDEMLRRARQLLETGEIATVDGQPSGREPVGEGTS